MKLHRLWLARYRNLQDITINFPATDREVLDRPPVHLLLGVNGTGKTGVLRALAHIFAQLEYREAPHLTFDLRYQIRHGLQDDEVHISGDGSGALTGVTFEVKRDDNAAIVQEPADWANFLPARTVVYTSGSLPEWRGMFSAAGDEQNRRAEERSELLHQQLFEGRSLQEVTGLGDLLDMASVEPVMAEVTRPRAFLFSGEHLELALLATLAIEDNHGDTTLFNVEQRRDIYHHAGIDRLVGFALRLQPLVAQSHEAVILEQVDLLVRGLFENQLRDNDEMQQRLQQMLARPVPELSEQHSARVRKLAALAAHRHRNPDGSYHLYFEISSETKLGLGGSQGLFTNPEQFFDFLSDLQERGVLAGVDLILQKTDLPEPLLSRHLSDGEHEFLGRMALFLLLRQPESLFLLDEPETHFNDVWKRDLVDLLATVLKGRESTVLLSTHSSIVISDVAHPQLVLLVKDDKGFAEVVDVQTPTFGADPSDIAINILGAPRAGGALSADRLTKALERGNSDELRALLDIVSPGYWRFRIRDRLESLHAASDSTA